MVSMQIAFYTSLLMLIVGPCIFPAPVTIFAPFLALASCSYSAHKALWLALLCGLILDIFSCHPFSMHIWSYLVAALLLYKLKRHLFIQSPTSLFVATALFSLIATCIQAFLFFHFSFNGRFLLTDLVIMPLMDGVYAFVCFVCPTRAYKEIRTFYLNRRAYEQ